MTSLHEVGPKLPTVAREAIESWLAERSEPRPPSDAPPAGVFVTLRDGEGQLRGCVGSLIPARPDVISETARSAVLAASGDPRFMPVTQAELDSLSIEVSVLSSEQAVQDLEELDPARYGVGVRDEAGRQGLLLPDVPGIASADLQVEVARRKAGIAAGSRVRLSRFEVQKYCEAR